MDWNDLPPAPLSPSWLRRMRKADWYKNPPSKGEHLVWLLYKVAVLVLLCCGLVALWEFLLVQLFR